MSAWEPDIGLEVHAHRKARTRLLYRCENRLGAEPDTPICPARRGSPGTLPVLQGVAVGRAIGLPRHALAPPASTPRP